MRNNFVKVFKKGVMHWWTSFLVSILALILGVWSLMAPDTTLVSMSWIFIIIFLFNGIMEITFSLENRHFSGRGWSLAGGIIEILFAALFIILSKTFLAVILVYVVGFWILFRSIWGIGEAAELQIQGVKYWRWLLTMAILTLLFSFFFLLSSTIFKGIFVVALISIAFFTYGIFRIYLVFSLRYIHKYIKKIEEC